MERYVLDTSVFTNPDVYAAFGGDVPGAVAAFAALARGAAERAAFYMPRSVYEELTRMRDLQEVAADFEMAVRIRSPRRHELRIPAEFLYEFIEEVRKRIDRGLRIAEEHAKLAGGDAQAQEVGRVINRLRARYREALRQGIIDSREDTDVLLLAYELDGVLVSADEGLCTWADKVGVRLLEPRHLRHVLEALAEGGSDQGSST
ncbi:MAG: RNA ligase partner protein [Gammaproteobacteria bacterium]|nr:MAG: RNA ligase partner protein [Gammaproteobacteria bacterium]